MDDVSVAICDEIALARSSSQRKQIFKDLQINDGAKPRMLILDMKVRWSSTFLMLYRAELLKKYVEEFVVDLMRKESNAEKRRRLQELLLTEDEWETVSKFCNLLQVADDAQHAFSAAARPTLHNALPAIEKMYSKWEKASEMVEYTRFKSALAAGMRKIEEYYERTAESSAHIVCMVLDPRKKFAHFERNWGTDLVNDVKSTVQTKFIEQYNKLRSPPSAASSSSQVSITRDQRNRADNKARHGARRAKIASLSDDEDELEPSSSLPYNPLEPWCSEWDAYLNTHEVVPQTMGIVQWWGLNASRYPTFASLARDYLAIMAASVSSERAFSSAGITISKRRNRLKGDVVEAIECLKCIFHHDLLFRRIVTSSDLSTLHSPLSTLETL
ncbi:hypothetical protein CVT24_002800 [Panaeolus cyanescens]|uniref:HAT C-terminal dimerisation domain-containing protein n=1 Tax=Panaeolus cyanescens TaxID=181874 RepID=A0A409YXZ1_9AGAR|nr:hypothetical protein CVT24_002800 [Panaeolus cyanescens]